MSQQASPATTTTARLNRGRSSPWPKKRSVSLETRNSWTHTGAKTVYTMSSRHLTRTMLDERLSRAWDRCSPVELSDLLFSVSVVMLVFATTGILMMHGFIFLGSWRWWFAFFWGAAFYIPPFFPDFMGLSGILLSCLWTLHPFLMFNTTSMQARIHFLVLNVIPDIFILEIQKQVQTTPYHRDGNPMVRTGNSMVKIWSRRHIVSEWKLHTINQFWPRSCH